MLEELEASLASWTPRSCIGNVLFRYAPFFKMYSQAFVRQLDAPQLLQRIGSDRPEFVEFLAAASASSECRGQTLDSYLILPVQRVPRYRLFLERLLEYTPAGHPDLPACREALVQVC